MSEVEGGEGKEGLVPVVIPDLARMIEKLDPDLWEGPLRDFWERAALSFLNEAKSRAPVDTGRLINSLARNAPSGIWQMASPHPLWMKVGTNVNREGFPYPRYLEESERTHYRGKHPNFVGQSTKGWFSSALDAARGAIDQALTTFAEEIGKRWRG